MTDNPRQQLHYIISHYGRSTCDDPKRCEALLKDLCPQHKREVNLLMGALREGIAKELLKPNQLLSIETVISRLSQKLHDELGFGIGLAQWAVESWAFALGINFNSAVITHSPKSGLGSPQTAKPTTPINQPSQAMIDQFKGWQKIGLQGEKLAVDATQWAAAIDEKTNLMWAINPSKMANFPNPKKEMTWDKAQTWAEHVNTQGWCGCTNWRLPTIDELKSLITKEERDDLTICTNIFADINTKNYWVWSSSLVTYDSSYAWLVYFGNGYGRNDYKGNSNHVRLVRSVQ